MNLAKLETELTLAAIAIITLGAIYLARKSAAGVATVAAAVNPTDPNNIFNTGVNDVVKSATGDQNATLGTWIYDLTHPNQQPGNAPTPLGGEFGMKPGEAAKGW